ncbi:MAG: hypothetical protein FE045_01605 [Thermoplasmata archaeon]|nr:MAG: hypothetical protein FE045_01605 [Thermoplasmata archaeon]
MRNYSIKRGHKADINKLIEKYFGVKGDVNEGIEFIVEPIGKIYMKKNGNNLIVDITPPSEVRDDYEAIKKWNQFLYEATGRTAKERRKLLEKESMK